MEEMAKEVLVAEVVVEVLAMNPPVKVEEAVEMKPLRKPRVVEVETPQGCTVQAKAPAPELAVSASQPKVPSVQVSMFSVAQFTRPLPYKPPEAVKMPVTVVEAAIVEEAEERKPPVKPTMVEVATPYEVGVKGKELAADEMVIGEAPRTVKEVQDTEPPQEALVVATP